MSARIIRFPRRPDPRPDLDERRAVSMLRPRSGNVRVEPRDSPEVQKAQAQVWAMHLIDSAFEEQR
jgi:hypothetical protein